MYADRPPELRDQIRQSLKPYSYRWKTSKFQRVRITVVLMCTDRESVLTLLLLADIGTCSGINDIPKEDNTDWQALGVDFVANLRCT